MKLRLIAESDRGQELRLFHGTFLDNLPSILRDGFTIGDGGRAHFGLTPRQAYANANPFCLIEVLTSRDNPNLVDPFLGYSHGSHPDADVSYFNKYDREALFNSPKLRDERAKYFAAMGKYVQRVGLASSTKEVNLPLPIGLTGDPRIVAAYKVDGGMVVDVLFGSGSLSVGDALV